MRGEASPPPLPLAVGVVVGPGDGPGEEGLPLPLRALLPHECHEGEPLAGLMVLLAVLAVEKQRAARWWRRAVVAAAAAAAARALAVKGARVLQRAPGGLCGLSETRQRPLVSEAAACMYVGGARGCRDDSNGSPETRVQERARPRVTKKAALARSRERRCGVLFLTVCRRESERERGASELHAGMRRRATATKAAIDEKKRVYKGQSETLSSKSLVHLHQLRDRPVLETAVRQVPPHDERDLFGLQLLGRDFKRVGHVVVDRDHDGRVHADL